MSDRSVERDMRYREQGFVYLWALFAVAMAGVIMAGTGQVWQIKSQREKEAELMYVGEQFRKAIMSYYNSSPGGGKEYPKTLNDLLLDSRSPVVKRHLRRIYRDPMTNTEEWGMIEETVVMGSVTGSNISGRITGVYSLSERKPLKKHHFPEHFVKFADASTYRDWRFAFDPNDAKKAPTSNAAQPAKPGQSGQSASPFASQSSAGSNQSPSASPSPFNAQPSGGAQPRNPGFGFPAGQQ